MTTYKNFSFFSLLQEIGKAMMLPVAVLPIAGLLLGVGSANFVFLPELLSSVMAQAGAAIFGNLPLLFAVGTAVGLSKNDGVAALASVVGFVVLTATMGVFAKYFGYPTKNILGMETIQTGVFGGIWIGVVSAWVFRNFSTVSLPSYLGFFSGKRLVPILTAFAAILSALVLSILWPPIGQGIESFSIWAAQENPRAAFTLYGFVERLLIPFGLHHIWNVPFFFQSGEYLDPVSGKILKGEIARYIGGDPSAGNLAGGYLFKMWGLPAAAAAIWMSAKNENKKIVGGVMFSAALTSFLTGITEPIEFAFMFLAPVLYLIHAIGCAAAYFICVTLEVKHGMTFSHGLIDFIVLFSQSQKAWLFALLGPLWAVLYFVVFTFAIRFFNLKTPGREELIESKSQVFNHDEKASGVLAALGGKKNLISLDACITRLRVRVNNPTIVDVEKLKKWGALNVLILSEGIQAIFGTESEILKTRIEKVLENEEHLTEQKFTLPQVILNSLNLNMSDLTFTQMDETRYRIETKKSVSLAMNQPLQLGSSGVMIRLSDKVFHWIKPFDTKQVDKK